jgi:hypothetical protein
LPIPAVAFPADNRIFQIHPYFHLNFEYVFKGKKSLVSLGSSLYTVNCFFQVNYQIEVNICIRKKTVGCWTRSISIWCKILHNQSFIACNMLIIS